MPENFPNKLEVPTTEQIKLVRKVFEDGIVARFSDIFGANTSIEVMVECLAQQQAIRFVTTFKPFVEVLHHNKVVSRHPVSIFGFMARALNKRFGLKIKYTQKAITLTEFILHPKLSIPDEKPIAYIESKVSEEFTWKE